MKRQQICKDEEEGGEQYTAHPFFRMRSLPAQENERLFHSTMPGETMAGVK
jgi:hypothetical protein